MIVEVFQSPPQNNHINEIINLKNECFGARIFNYIPDNFIVAVEDDKVVGYCGLDFDENELHIESLCVSLHYRRKGIGTAILDKAYEFGGKSCKYLTLEVNRHRDNGLLQFYEKRGFVANIRPGYSEICLKKYIGVNQDQLLLLRHQNTSYQQ